MQLRGGPFFSMFQGEHAEMVCLDMVEFFLLPLMELNLLREDMDRHSAALSMLPKILNLWLSRKYVLCDH